MSMTLAPTSPSSELRPLQLPWDLRLNAEQFDRVCQANPDASLVRLERWQALSPEQRQGLRPSVRIWWWNWPALPMMGRVASARCAAGWTPTWPMAPSWAGC